MNKQTIAVIVTIKKVAEAARRLIAEAGDSIRVYNCYWGDAIRVAGELKKRGVKIIVCMGLTSQMVQQHTNLPVVEIQYSGLECLAAVEKAYQYSDNIAVLGSESIRYQMRRVCAHLGRDFPIYTLSQDKTPEEQVKELLQFGHKVIISGSPSSEIADSLGLKGVNLVIDDRVIASALNTAKRFSALMAETEEKGQIIHAILDSTSEGMICTDKRGGVSYANAAAEDMLGCQDEGIGRQDIVRIVRESGRDDIISPCQAPDSGFIVTGKTPILIDGKDAGTVYAIRKVAEIQRLEQQIRRELLSKGHFAKNTFEDIIGESEILRKTIHVARKYARYDSTVLITGESGTGKEMFAQSIHNASSRRTEAFVAVNCAALPENLLESELFGYVKGAFSGARSEGKAGLFEMAHKGTIFLDEIGEIPLSMQGKLLRVLQENQLARIGDDRVVTVDVRVLCATNKDLYDLVERGMFREDLYYRLHVLELVLPPLRARTGDVGRLARALMRQKNARLGTRVRRIAPRLEKRLEGMEWKGNVRQLSNVIERMLVVCEGDVLDEGLLDAVLPRGSGSGGTGAGRSGVLEKTELQTILDVLKQTNGNKTRAAEILGIGTATLWRKLKKANL